MTEVANATGGLPGTVWAALILSSAAIVGQIVFGVFARRQRQAVTIANLVDAHQQIAEDALAALERSQDEKAELQDRIAELQDENTALRKQAAKRIPDVVSSLQEAILSGGISKGSKPESPG